MTKRYLEEKELLKFPFVKESKICLMKSETYKSRHESIMQTGITCKKIPCLRKTTIRLACGVLPKMLKYFDVTLKFFYPAAFNKLNYPFVFLDWDNKLKLVSAYFYISASFFYLTKQYHLTVINLESSFTNLHINGQDLLKALGKSFIYGFVFKVINDRTPCSKGFARNSRGINLWK